MLRESSKAKGEHYELTALLGGSGGNVPHGSLLVGFAEAVLGGDEDRLSRTRSEITAELGDAALVDAAAVVATFNAIDRVADSTGIPIEDAKAEATADFRKTLGLDAFAEKRGEVADRRGRQ